MSEKKKIDVAVVGVGPAGISSSIYLKRAGHSILLFERNKPGGLLRNANLVENYPGFPGGISGKDLSALMKRQAENLGIRIIKNEVKSVGIDNDGSFVMAVDRKKIGAASVIIATGTKPKAIKLNGIERIKNRIYFEVADIPAAKISGKRFAVIGGGDAAFDYSLFIHAHGGKPVILMQSRPKCLPLLLERADEKKILHFKNTTPSAVCLDKGGIVVNCHSAEREMEIKSDYLLVACGREPAIPAFDKTIENRLRGWRGIVETPVPGLFFAGDVMRGRFRQAGIAVGDGIRAAMLADEYLRKKRRQDGCYR